MDIYVVQQGDDINSIAERYGVSAAKLILDNELENHNLVTGQAIVIAQPEQTHTVQEGDTLGGIAAAYGTTYLRLLRYNPYLSGREYIYPGEVLTISYHTERTIITNGFTYPYIKRETLIKTLPQLTYLSVFNYQATGEGEIITFYDDSEVIQTAISFGVIPLLMVATLSPTGEPNIELAFSILINEELQKKHINKLVNMVKVKGYYGINMTFNYLSKTTEPLYNNYVTKVSARLKEEGLLYFVTINPNIKSENNNILFDKVDYTLINQKVDEIIFLQFIWGINTGPPAPVSSIAYLRTFMDYVLSNIPPDKVLLGKPIIGYDWLLPYIPGRTTANSITLEAFVDLANDTDEAIQFDETSQTPFLLYNRLNFGAPAQRIAWSIDARSIDALTKLMNDEGLAGTGLWNIMVFYPWIWLIINSKFEILHFLPESPDL